MDSFNEQLSHIQKLILKKINEYENISLFFHEAPDFDALGSCFGVKEFIKENFPNKNVKIIGLDTLEKEYLSTIFVDEDTYADDQFISKSLGIISDTSNEARVYSGKHRLCMETIRVDHHVEVENFCDNEWIDPIYPAACQMWASLVVKSGLKLSPLTAKYFYAGIITDTGRFLHYNTTPETYYIAYELIKTGFNRAEVHTAVYTKSKYQILFSSYIFKRTKIKNGIAYAVIPARAFSRFKVKIQHSMVHVLSNIKDVKIWTTLYYDRNLKKWKGSLRSVNIPVNHLAEKYNGGGHKFAAGFSLNNKREYQNVIKDIEEYLKDISK